MDDKGFLVLSRKENETICIGNDIEVTLIEIDRNKIRLAVIAPKSVVVLRKELMTKGEAK